MTNQSLISIETLESLTEGNAINIVEQLAKSTCDLERMVAWCAGYPVRSNIADEPFSTRLMAVKYGAQIETLCNAPEEEIRAETIYWSESCKEALVTDPSELVRAKIALLESHIDILHKDSSSMVKAAVASKGFYIEELYENADDHVLCGIAASGHYHDKLYNHANPQIRATVALAGGYLDHLEEDESPIVRAAVAANARYATRLINDESMEAQRTLASIGVNLPMFQNSEWPQVRAEVAAHGNMSENFKYDPSAYVRSCAARTKEGFRHYLYDLDDSVALAAKTKLAELITQQIIGLAKDKLDAIRMGFQARIDFGFLRLL